MKKGLLCSLMLLTVGVFAIAGAFADTPKKPVSPSFEQLEKSSPVSAHSLLSAPRVTLGATINVPGDYATIEAAVAVAGPGDQIVVAAGTYPISAQVVIDHDLAIIGAGSGLTTITTSFSTGNAGSARGWFYVPAGSDFDLSGVTLDGAGQLVWQAIRNFGTGGSAHDVVFKNIKYNESGPDYQGVAIAAGGTGPMSVTDCVFSEIGRVGILFYGPGVSGSSCTGNTYTGKGPGNWLDYGFELGSGAVVTLDDCVVSECRGVAVPGGWVSGGILVTQAATGGLPGSMATITHCDITDNTLGIAAGYSAVDASVVVANNNAIHGNEWGIDNTNLTVDASANWWGSNVEADVVAQLGGAIDFTPWLDNGDDKSGDPGFQGDFSVLNVGAAGSQVGTTGRIQEGIGLVSGSTVNVAAGLYDERITVNTAVTLRGAGIGASVIDASASVAVGAVVTISITSGNVLFDGFTIKTGTSLNGITASSTSSGSTITISHNRIEGFGPTAVGDNFGLIAGYGSLASLVFTYNEIANCGSNSILLERHVGPTDVSYNTFDRNHGDESSDAYFNMNYGGADITTLQKVSHNTIDLGAGTLFTNDTRGAAISIVSSYTGVVGGFTNVQITDNIIVNLKPYRRGISFWNNAPAGTVSGAVGDINAPVVSGNTVTNASSYTGQFGIRLLGLVTNATVTNNDCDGVEYGFRGQAYNGNLPVGAVVNGNSFTNVTYYSDWGGTGTLDASANWWGSKVAATVATKVSGAVDYTPWLDNGDDKSGDPGFQGDYSALRVAAASPQTGSKGRVQEGVDLVTGSTVYLEDGIYIEQVEIAKDMTLTGGGGGGAIIQSPNVLTKFFGTNKPIVYIHDAGNVIVKNLVVDGAGKGNSNYRFVGIGFNNAGGKVDSCTVKNVQDTPFSGAQHGVAIYTWQSDGLPHSVAVWNNTVFAFQKTGMALNASDTTPLTVDVRGNVVTGAGATAVTAQNGIQVWAPAGGGTVVDNAVSGIGYTGSSAVATSLLQMYGDVDFIGNTVTNGQVGIYNNYGAGDVTGNNITVSMIGSYCDGIIAADPVNKVASPFASDEQAGAPGTRVVMGGTLFDINVTGNTVAFSGPTNTGSYGIEAYAGYSPEDLDVAINGNDVSGFEYGIVISKCTGSGCSTGLFTSLVAQHNSMTGNTGYGMYSDVDYLTTDGRYNWWGAASGPFHTTLNPSGTGNQVSDYILFEPYLGAPNEVGVVPQYTLTNCTTPRTVTVHLDQVGIPTDEVRGYEIKFTVNPLVATVGGFVEGTFLSSAGPTTFYAQNNGGGAYTVSCAILGGTVGGKNGGDLFSMTLTPVAEGTSDIAFTSIKIRDLDNAPLPGAGLAGSIVVDCSYPTMEAIVEAQNAWYNTAPAFSNFGFDDDVNLDIAEYKIDGGSWTTIFSGIDAATWDSDGWVLPGFVGLSQGTHTVYFRVKDDAGNWNGEGTPQPNLYSWMFRKDTVAPAPPTNFVSMPGHNKTHLTWTNPTGDATFDKVEIRFNPWSAYPHYLAPAPVYPGDHTLGTFVALVAAAAYDDNPRAPRDIYYYAAFSKDSAGNYSVLGPSAKDRTTSYWLGDVIPNPAFDGLVNLSDLAAFSNTFGVSEGGGGWVADCDFGPTDDWSRFGIPLPDNMVDFEDLMIFSMNYSKVTPLGLSDALASGKLIEELGDLVKFEIVPSGGNTVSIVLKNRASTLKGIHVVVEISGGELEAIERGSVLGSVSPLFFGTIPSAVGHADICISALGVDVPFQGSGEIARLVLKPSSESAATVRIKALDLRNLDNKKYEIVVTEEIEAPFVPKATALMQNFPNPFNPSTTLAFDVAQAGNVTIQIYDVSGRLVATLLNSYKEVGRHRVEWNGKNASGSLVPSGIYFYRMRAAGFEVTKKMILVR